eukprot:14710_4
MRLTLLQLCCSSVAARLSRRAPSSLSCRCLMRLTLLHLPLLAHHLASAYHLLPCSCLWLLLCVAFFFFRFLWRGPPRCFAGPLSLLSTAASLCERAIRAAFAPALFLAYCASLLKGAVEEAACVAKLAVPVLLPVKAHLWHFFLFHVA